MKILVLCERVDAEGGTETYLRALLPALAARGDEIRVIARTAAQPDAYGVPATAVTWSDEHDEPDAAAAARVERLAREFAPDVAAIHTVLDAAVVESAQRCAPRTVYHLHDHRPFCPNGDRLYPQGGTPCTVAMSRAACSWHALVNGCAYGPRLRTVGLIDRRERLARTVRASDRTVVLSEYVARLARINGVNAARSVVVEPPLEEAAFAAAPAPRPASDAVLFAGRVHPSKGARSLVRALARIDAARRPVVRIAGDGPDLQGTLEEARDRAVVVEALGRLSAGELRAAYDAAALVAVPSLWAEPFGLVGIEAFARGRPVVAYDAGGIAQWCGSGAGVLVPRGDEAALARAIVEMLEPQRWSAASANALQRAQRYRLADHVAALRAIYGGA